MLHYLLRKLSRREITFIKIFLFIFAFEALSVFFFISINYLSKVNIFNKSKEASIYFDLESLRKYSKIFPKAGFHIHPEKDVSNINVDTMSKAIAKLQKIATVKSKVDHLSTSAPKIKSISDLKVISKEKNKVNQTHSTLNTVIKNKVANINISNKQKIIKETLNNKNTVSSRKVSDNYNQSNIKSASTKLKPVESISVISKKISSISSNKKVEESKIISKKSIVQKDMNKISDKIDIKNDISNKKSIDNNVISEVVNLSDINADNLNNLNENLNLTQSNSIDEIAKDANNITDVNDVINLDVLHDVDIAKEINNLNSIIYYAQTIKKEICKNWKIPKGLPKGLTIKVKYFINSKGKAEQVNIIKSSGKRSYDQLLKAAIYRSNFPKKLANSNIVIKF